MDIVPMKRIACALLLSLSCFTPTLGVVLTHDRQAEAARAWKPFYAAFRRAVDRRDRTALRAMMTADLFSSGGVDNNLESAFAYWDESGKRGWPMLSRSLSRGTVPMDLWWNNGQPHQYPCRVAPPQVNRKGSPYRGKYAIFEFRDDGRWYCTVFNGCCD